MVDFEKKITNSNKFRTPALTFLATGAYCSYPKNTSEYMTFWETEKDKCINGYTADDGDFITGYNYFYLNYCPIIRIVNNTTVLPDGTIKNKRTSERTFPDFYDYDYYFFQGIQEAEDNGKHMAVSKSRRKGYSYKAASMAIRNFFLIPDSKTYVYASNKQYLTDDGILTKAWDYMDFVDEHTAWGKKRQVANTTMRRRASYIVTDEYGNKVEVGYKSEIIGLSLKDNPDVVRGKRGKLIIFEEAGSFPELGAAWQIARPSVEQDGDVFGLMLAFGTGGDEGPAIAALKDMFYKPESYNCIGFNNIWDEGNPTDQCGFFIPQYTNLDIRDDDGKRIFMDDDGNTFHDKARSHILALREKETKAATDTRAVDRYIAERCISPMEAFMEFSGNIFPKKALQTRLAKIRTNKKLQNLKQIGDLNWVNNEVQWTIKKQGDVTTFPLSKDADPTGAIVIWEHPIQDPPIGLYIIGVDPYDHDHSGTNSLGSCIVYKRFQNFESYSEVIVAEYTGRPKTAEMFYDNVRKLATYYNAKIMYENQNKGLFSYFSNKHSDWMLADQPSILKDIVSNSKVERGKGSHVSKEIKIWGEGKIKEWLEETRGNNDTGVDTLLSEPLIEELIGYNDKGNFDRVMALMQIMIFREQLYNLQVKKKEDVEKQMRLFDRPIFSARERTTYPTMDNNITTYMFTN